MRELRLVLGVLRSALGAVIWLASTIWLGCKATWRVGALIARWRKITAETRVCPRGHSVPVYGLWDCACGSRLEGWAFSRCDVCHETAAYVPCGICGLPVRNPVLQ